MKVWILTYGDTDEDIAETDGVYAASDHAREQFTLLARDIDPGFEICDAEAYESGSLSFEVGAEWVELEPFDVIEPPARIPSA